MRDLVGKIFVSINKKNDKTTKIFGYQFAIISKYQNSMFIKFQKFINLIKFSPQELLIIKF